MEGLEPVVPEGVADCDGFKKLERGGEGMGAAVGVGSGGRGGWEGQRLGGTFGLRGVRRIMVCLVLVLVFVGSKVGDSEYDGPL